MLWALAESGKAPRFLAKVNRRGVPMNALLATTTVGAACFLTTFIGDGAAYVWLVSTSGLAGFIVWMGIAWSHYRFRKAYTAQGHDLADLPYRARFFPLGPMIALVLCAVVILGQNYQAFAGDVDLGAALSAYIGLPLFLALWFGHRLVTGSKMVRYEDADLSRV
jgi:lysine-specific permease